jgi:putative addiction module component (TIGR02574 family)
MSTNTLRKKLRDYLEIADDKKIKALYAIMEDDIEESVGEYSDKFKKELDRRYADYKSGKSKMITAAESNRRIQRLLKSSKKR